MAMLSVDSVSTLQADSVYVSHSTVVTTAIHGRATSLRLPRIEWKSDGSRVAVVRSSQHLCEYSGPSPEHLSPQPSGLHALPLNFVQQSRRLFGFQKYISSILSDMKKTRVCQLYDDFFSNPNNNEGLLGKILPEN